MQALASDCFLPFRFISMVRISGSILIFGRSSDAGVPGESFLEASVSLQPFSLFHSCAARILRSRNALLKQREARFLGDTHHMLQPIPL